MTIPNMLTIGRLVMTAFFMYYMMQHNFLSVVIATGLFITAAVTDFLDGYLARRLNQISDFGKIMDPIADKALTLAALFIFAFFYKIITWWPVIAIAAREIGLTLIRFNLLKQGKVIAADQFGKLKTVLQMGAIILGLLYLLIALHSEWSLPYVDQMVVWQQWLDGLVFFTMLITLASGYQFLTKNGLLK